MKKVYGQFIKFSLVGVFNTLVDFFIYYCLNRWLGINFLIANAFAFIGAATFSYLLNRSFTFRINAKLDFLEYGYYVFFGTITLVIVEYIMYLGVEVYKFNDLLVKLAATIISVVLNFTFSKKIIFKA